MQQTAIVLLGPTASGKSAAAMEVLPSWPCDIVSVDSCQVYRGMDIGTAKPSSEDQLLVPHHLIDICDPHERYGVSQFIEDAHRAMTDIEQQDRVPVLVGGTAMFVRRMQEGLAHVPAIDPEVRKAVLLDYQTRGLDVLWLELLTAAPSWGDRLHAHDAQRIMRALEVYRQTGKQLYDYWSEQSPSPWHFHTLILMPATRHDLALAARSRIDQMLSHGFIDEVASLRESGLLHDGMPAMRSVGYRQIWSYLEGHVKRSELADEIQSATMRYIKHQMTWLQSWSDATWVEPAQGASYLKKLCQKIIKIQ